MASTPETLKWRTAMLEKSGMSKVMDDLFNNATPIEGQNMNDLKQEVKKNMCTCEPEKLEDFFQDVQILLLCTQVADKLFEGITCSDGSVNVDELKHEMIKKMASCPPEKLEELLKTTLNQSELYKDKFKKKDQAEPQDS